MKKLIALLLLPFFLASWSHGTAYSIFNVGDYQSSAQRADAAAWTCSVDQTSAISSAVAAANVAVGGSELYFPPGRYCTNTCGFVISSPMLIDGNGSSAYFANTGVSQVECSTTNTTLFTVTSPWARFANIALVGSAGSPVSGSKAIFVNGSVVSQRVNYDDIMISGFYDAVDVAVGGEWSMRAVQILNFKHWGVRIRNTINVDEGDWAIIAGSIYPASGAAAGIRIESSGGGKIIGTKLVAYSGSYTDGVSIDTTGAVSGQILINQINIEGTTGIPINMVKGWPYVFVTASYLNAGLGTGPAINCSGCSYGVFADNVMIGNSAGPAITLSSSNNMVIGPNQDTNGFTSPVSGGTAINVDFRGWTFTVATLPNIATVAVGTRAWVTDANSTTFNAAAVGGGGNAVPVHATSGGWVIG